MGIGRPIIRQGFRLTHGLCGLGLALSIAPPLVTPASAANSSAYTTLDLGQCRQEPPDPDDPLQSGVWWCEGHGGMPVYVAEGDLRFFVSYGEDAANEKAAVTTLPGFNHVGGTIEWRLDDTGTPFATILRFYTADPEGGPEGQTLVLTRLGPPGAVCHMGYVDARQNPDANAIARDVVDNGARSFDCARETPLQYGLTDGDARE